MRDFQKRFKEGAELNVGDEHLVRYINFLEAIYRSKENKENQWDHNDVTRQLHHDIKGFKRIEFMIYYQSGGKTQLQKPKGIEMVEGERIARKETRIANEIAKDFSDNRKWNEKSSLEQVINANINSLKTIENVTDLVTSLEAEKSLVNKKRLVAEYIYKNHLPKRYKENAEGITVEDLMETHQVSEMAETNAEQLFIDFGAFRIWKENPSVSKNYFSKYRQVNAKKLSNRGIDFIKLQRAFNKSLALSKEGKLPYGAYDIYKSKGNQLKFRTHIGTTFLLSKDGRKYTPIKSLKKDGISGAIVSVLRAQNFETMYQMPGGEKTAIESKRHQIDILMSMMPMFKEMNNTPEGQTRLKTLFGDNPLIKRMLENGIEPKIIQILGAEMYTDKGREGYNAGEATANDYTNLQLDLIIDAINGNKKEYSQSISIFSDKSVEVHLNNAPLYTLEEAKAKQEEMENAGVVSNDEFVYFKNGLREYLNEQNIKLPRDVIEQIALNYAINKYYAKDLFIGPKKYFKNTGDYIKRSAGSVAMHVGLGDNVRIEPIMLNDVMMHVHPETREVRDTTDMSSEEIKKLEDKGFVDVNRADAGSFILPEDALYIEKTYGQARPVGKHYKFVYYGQNLDNTTLENKVGIRHPFYGKTNVFVLNSDFFRKNPNFKHLAESLRIRKRNSIGDNTKYTIPMIMFSSAIKVGGNLQNNYLSVNNLAELNKNDGQKLNEHQNSLFEFVDNEGNAQYGLDGSFFGIQTELDKRGSDASISKQLMMMMYSNPDIRGEVDVLMGSIVDAFKTKSDEVFNRFGTKEKKVSEKDILKILNNTLEAADPDTYSKSVIQLIREGSLDSGTFDVLQSIIRSNIIKQAIKMRAPGGLGIQSTDFAVGEEVAGNKISLSAGLAGYVRDENQNVIEPAEIIIDESTAKSLKLDVHKNNTVIIQRIPTSKMGDGVVCKVVQITKGQGTMIMIPSEVSDIIGSDLDGDGLHIVGKHPGDVKGAKSAWNEAFDNLSGMLMDGRNVEYTKSGINELDNVVRTIKENLGIKTPVLNDLSIKDNRDIYLSNREGQKNIGISATYNNGHKILSAYNVQGVELNISIDGVKIERSYKDKGKSWLNLAYILNIFLDDANKGFAADFNLNEHTFPVYGELISRGVDLETAVKIMTHPFVIDMVNVVRNDKNVNSIQELSREILGVHTGVTNIDTKFSDTFQTEQAIAALITRVSDRTAKNQIDAIRSLVSLDTNMPETAPQGADLIDSIIAVATGGVRVRDGRILELGEFDEGTIVDAKHLLTSKKDAQSLRRHLFEGNFNAIRDAIEIKNPIVKKNFEYLLRYLENERKLDPAFNNYQVINRIFPTAFDGVLEWGLTKKNKKAAIEKIMARVRVESLFQEGIYNDAISIFTNEANKIIQNGEIENGSAIAELNKLDAGPQSYVIHNLIKNLVKIHEGSGGNYQYISSFLHVREKLDFKDGYIDINKTGEPAYINNDGVLVNLERKYGEEYEIVPNMDMLKNMDPKTIKNIFERLPKDIQNFLYLYDAVINNHTGVNSLFPYLHGDMRGKINKASRNQVINRDSGALSDANVSLMAESVLKNNKGPIRDISSILQNKRGESIINKKSEPDWAVKSSDKGTIRVGSMRGRNLIFGSIVKLSLKTKNNKNIDVLYRVLDNFDSSGFYVLAPIKDFRDSTIPSNKKLNKETQEPSSIKMYQLADDFIISESSNKAIGKTKDGKNIVDQDGKYGSEQMFQLVEEEEFFNEQTELNFADWARDRYQVSDIQNLDDEQMAKYDERDEVTDTREKIMDPNVRGKLIDNPTYGKKIKNKNKGELIGGLIFEYQKYLNDINTAEQLTEKYLKKDVLGSTELEKAKYSVKRLLLIMRVEIQPLDEAARAKLYKEVSKVLAAKLALQSIDHILKSNKDLTTEEKADYKNLRVQILKGEKSVKDISKGDLWLSPDITTKERLEVGELLKEIDNAEMNYRRDLKKLKRTTDKAYDALLKEKFKGMVIPWQILRAMYNTLPVVRYLKASSKYIYGNLVHEVEDVDAQGRYYRTLEMRNFLNEDGTVSEAKMKEANLTEAEKAYYKMFIETTSMFESHLSQRKGTDGQPVLKRAREKVYIPNRTASRFEMMISRKLTSAFIAFNYDSSLRNIHVKDEKGRVATLGDFIEEAKQDQAYQGLSVKDFSRKEKIKRLVRQAERHLKSGKDSAGLPAVRAENVENLTSGEYFNRYTHARSAKSSFSASYQIHNSLNQYIEQNLFYHGLNSEAGNAKGYSFSGAQDLLPLIDGIINYQEFKNNPSAVKWVKELYKDRWLFRKDKTSLIAKEGEKSILDKASRHLMAWTMFVGLALKPKVAVLNVLIGKYNEFGRAGGKTMWKGEQRFWTDLVKNKGTYNSKTWGITDYFGLISEPTQITTEGMFGGPFGQFMFMFMTGSEAYIQRASFISQLTDAQWDSFKVVDGELIVTNEAVFETIKENAPEMKDNVYSVQGRGYTATDQRLIQNYYIADSLLQFKRWFPTFVMDRIGREKMDRFGKKKVGSLTASGAFLYDMLSDGKLGDIREEFANLEQYKKDAIWKAINRGFVLLLIGAVIVFAGGFDDDEEESGVVSGLQDLMMDMMLLVNVKKLSHMASAPMLQTAENISMGFYNLFTGAKYQRKTKRFDAGEPKFKGDFLKTMPLFLRDALEGKNE